MGKKTYVGHLMPACVHNAQEAAGNITRIADMNAGIDIYTDSGAELKFRLRLLKTHAEQGCLPPITKEILSSMQGPLREHLRKAIFLNVINRKPKEQLKC